MPRRLLRMINNVRRFFFYNFYQSYLIRKAKERKGECKKCGFCCQGCIYLGDDNKCKTYNNRPRWCHKDAPIDEFDQKAHGTKEKCGFYW